MANEPINVAMYRYHMQQIAKAEKPKLIVEVGVYCADLSRLLLSGKTVEKLVLVDRWDGLEGWKSPEHMQHIYESVQAWAKTDPRVQLMKMPSVEAARFHKDGSIDFWHLDGHHSEKDVLEDLVAWRPKVKPGKLMTGDNFEIEGVSNAVKKVFGKKFQIEGKGRIWIARV